MPEPRVVLPGSQPVLPPGTKRIGPANPSERIDVTVYVRRRSGPPPNNQPDTVMSREEFAAAYGASPDDLRALREFAKEYNLEPDNESAAKRSVELHGTVADMSRAFGVSLEYVEIDGHTYRHQVGEIAIPEDLQQIVQGVIGLDNCPQARPY
jgi:kumamolisin